ncbi:MAG: bifunctional nicotinamidase/pyrazinamidase [Bradyrhizobium sp.]|nr:MAG: bifunctional nicotinamidase/pyrazinamidase [Bradyrhizobium sp.]
MALGADDVLIVVDMQNDFIRGGALAVPGGESLTPLVNRLIGCFRQSVLTQDWHPAGHSSFASSHPGAKLFDRIAMSYGEQVLWPNHCVQGSHGAALVAGLDVTSPFLILRKGVNGRVDSYSAFLEADRATTTGLAALLKARQVARVFVCGLATDFCVAFTALDARAAGFETFVVEDASRAIDADGSLDAAWARMDAAGVTRINSSALLG